MQQLSSSSCWMIYDRIWAAFCCCKALGTPEVQSDDVTYKLSTHYSPSEASFPNLCTYASEPEVHSFLWEPPWFYNVVAKLLLLFFGGFSGRLYALCAAGSEKNELANMISFNSVSRLCWSSNCNCTIKNTSLTAYLVNIGNSPAV